MPAEALAIINTLSDDDIPDVSIKDTYGRYVYLLYGAGILNGSDIYGNFKPVSDVFRSEIAAIINRLAVPSIRLSYNPTLAVTYNYHDFLTSENKQLTFDYNDSFFSEPSNILNGNLAKASIALSTAAFGNTESGGDKNIAETFEKIGYTVLVQQNYDSDLTDDSRDFAAYTIASKNCIINKKNYTVYSIIIRGTLETSEWYSNFDIGENENAPHKGFTDAAADIYESFGKYITAGKDNTIIWLASHSRGAAITNIIAANLNENKQFAENRNIYTYTFGCPSITKDPYCRYITRTSLLCIFHG